MFKRGKGGAGEPEDAQTDVSSVAGDVSEQTPAESAGTVAAGQGPFDISVAPDDQVQRVDLGGLQIPVVDRMELHLEGADEESGSFAVAIVVIDDGALQLMAVAAPRSGGFWSDVMGELESEIGTSGGSVQRSEGTFGPELVGNVPAQDPEGKVGTQPARFVGAEGPRWFLRGMFMGSAAIDPARGEFFEDILAGCIVNRGAQPMAPGDLIALRPPADMVAEGEDDESDESGTYEDLEPFERGPEITETH